MKNNNEIPKIIHYCWFGRNPLPSDARKCIDSWKKFFPDYSIKQWDENNFDIESCTYAKQAYEARKWAFVSDYARFKILYENGGVYFDTDVEVIKSFEDIIVNGSYIGTERQVFPDIYGNKRLSYGINPGLGIAFEKGNDTCKKFVELYEKRSFLKEDKTMDLTTIVQFTSDYFIKRGFDIYNDRFQIIENVQILPWDYLCPLFYQEGQMDITKNTRSIHHYSETWVSKPERIINTIRKKYKTNNIIIRVLIELVCVPLKMWKKILQSKKR